MDINVIELKERIDQDNPPIMIDVREPHEWDMQHLPGVEKVSLGTIPAELDNLRQWKDQEVVLICRSGGRSGKATQFLKQQGFEKARNLTGGMLAWKEHVDPEFNVQ